MKNLEQTRYHLAESDIPRFWYNMNADSPVPPTPVFNPATKELITKDTLETLFPQALIEQETTMEQYVPIPDEVREIYKLYRPTSLIRARRLEKALDTPAHIYFKYEGESPAGSHKLNSAIPQAFFNKISGTQAMTTETGAGQWGSALSFACHHFGIECEVYMVKISFKQKPYRKLLMNTWGATVFASPSTDTAAGRSILEKDPESPGSLGIAISEAVERAAQRDDTKYALGSVLNHVLMHQTIIGLEAEKQMEKAGDLPDIVIAPFGGGSNFAGLAFPFLRQNLEEGRNIRCIAAEPASCPKLTRGVFRYDFGDTVGMTPLIPMYTLGHNFVPSPIHAGGLRYHGAGAIVSQLLHDGLIEAQSVPQLECFESGVKFAGSEGILPAPEATHGIAIAAREARAADLAGTPKTILFNLCGHGYLDMAAYQSYFDGKIIDHEMTQGEIDQLVAQIDTPAVE